MLGWTSCLSRLKTLYCTAPVVQRLVCVGSIRIAHERIACVDPLTEGTSSGLVPNDVPAASYVWTLSPKARRPGWSRTACRFGPGGTDVVRAGPERREICPRSLVHTGSSFQVGRCPHTLGVAPARTRRVLTQTDTLAIRGGSGAPGWPRGEPPGRPYQSGRSRLG